MANNIAMVYHNLAVMLEASVPLLKSLRTVGSAAKGKLHRVFTTVTDVVSSGNGLAEAMAQHPKVFAPLDLLVIEVGENSGNLSEALKLLSEWYELQGRLRRILISGMMLPIILVHLAAVLGPLPLLFLGNINTFQYLQQVVAGLALFYVPTVVILAIVRLTPNTGILRRILDGLTLRIPLLGRAVRQIALCRYCRAFNMMIKAGVPGTQCAEKAAALTGNAVITTLLEGGTESCRAGNPIWEGFPSKLPIDFRQSWQIGEETGNLDDVTERLADSTAQTAQRMLKEFCRWLPILIYWSVLIFMAMQILRAYGSIYATGLGN